MSGNRIMTLGLLATVLTLVILPMGPRSGEAGQVGSNYKVLAPISRGNLTIFPVVADRTHDTRSFLTLDEGVRGASGGKRGRQRAAAHSRTRTIYPRDGAEVNPPVLVNKLDRPLILLAGEIVTGANRTASWARTASFRPIATPSTSPCFVSSRNAGLPPNLGWFISFADGAAQRAAQRHGRPKSAEGLGGSWRRQAIHGYASLLCRRPGAGRYVFVCRVMDNDEVKHRVDAVAVPSSSPTWG